MKFRTKILQGGKFMVGVSADVREKAGVAGGETVDVDIELDTAPREVAVPADFAAALKKDAKAQKFFDSLSYSNKSRHVLMTKAGVLLATGGLDPKSIRIKSQGGKVCGGQTVHRSERSRRRICPD